MMEKPFILNIFLKPYKYQCIDSKRKMLLLLPHLLVLSKGILVSCILKVYEYYRFLVLSFFALIVPFHEVFLICFRIPHPQTWVLFLRLSDLLPLLRKHPIDGLKYEI